MFVKQVFHDWGDHHIIDEGLVRAVPTNSSSFYSHVCNHFRCSGSQLFGIRMMLLQESLGILCVQPAAQFLREKGL